MKNRYVRFVFLIASCLIAVSALSGCGSDAPDIESVREEFGALITASAEINDIFFGGGLPVYPRTSQTGEKNVSYDEQAGIYYWLIPDEAYREVIKYYDPAEKINRYAVREADYAASGRSGAAESTLALGGEEFSCRLLEDYEEPGDEFVYEDSDPVYYDYVRTDCPYQTAESIKNKAEEVYSADYLEQIYVMIFDGYKTDENIIFARYMTSDDGRFMAYNGFTPYFEKQTEYDLSSMKIVKPSSASSVNVEITAYGTYIDYEKLEKATGEFKRVLKFIKTADGWRLDTPTY